MEGCMASMADPAHHSVDGLLTLLGYTARLCFQQGSISTQGTLANTLLSKRSDGGQGWTDRVFDLTTHQQQAVVTQRRRAQRSLRSYALYLYRRPPLDNAAHGWAIPLKQKQKPLPHHETTGQKSPSTINRKQQAHAQPKPMLIENKKWDHELVPSTVSLVSSPGNSSHHAAQERTTLTARFTLVRYARASSGRAINTYEVRTRGPCLCFFTYIRVSTNYKQPATATCSHILPGSYVRCNSWVKSHSLIKIRNTGVDFPVCELAELLEPIHENLRVLMFWNPIF